MTSRVLVAPTRAGAVALIWLLRRARLVGALVAAALLALVATATLSFAGEQEASPQQVRFVAPRLPVLLVPDVRGQAYVFAKTALDESGFAWRVEGPVRGYAANRVASQRPVPGTRVVDTGRPTITLVLTRKGATEQQGAPENTSPFAGTEVRTVGAR